MFISIAASAFDPKPLTSVASSVSTNEPLLRPAAGVTLDDALTGGEDHALVACVPAGTELPAGVRAVGRVEPGSGVTVLGHEPTTSGWELFS